MENVVLSEKKIFFAISRDQHPLRTHVVFSQKKIFFNGLWKFFCQSLKKNFMKTKRISEKFLL
jgi:hypothetical protein